MKHYRIYKRIIKMIVPIIAILVIFLGCNYIAEKDQKEQEEDCKDLYIKKGLLIESIRCSDPDYRLPEETYDDCMKFYVQNIPTYLMDCGSSE